MVKSPEKNRLFTLPDSLPILPRTTIHAFFVILGTKESPTVILNLQPFEMPID
jgi:hypothetical protein